MPFEGLARMNDANLRSIYLYVQTLPSRQLGSR
jgi:hypothetical protein